MGNHTVGSGTMTASVVGSTNNGVAADANGLVISGDLGTATTSAIAANESAYNIAASINAIQSQTGVEAKAQTTATLSGLTAGGTISFNLAGKNVGSAVAVSASIGSPNDLQALADAINAQAATTGITATASGGTVTLENNEGYDIALDTFALSGANNDSINITGSSGNAATLTEGGNVDGVVGGALTMQSSSTFSIDAVDGSIAAANSSTLSNIASVDVGTQTGANSAIDTIDAALAFVDSSRGDLGAIQNRLSSTIANLSNASENISAARSRILDADFASETAELTKGQILQQAGVAMLTQANSAPQTALSLLQG